MGLLGEMRERYPTASRALQELWLPSHSSSVESINIAQHRLELPLDPNRVIGMRAMYLGKRNISKGGNLLDCTLVDPRRVAVEAFFEAYDLTFGFHRTEDDESIQDQLHILSRVIGTMEESNQKLLAAYVCLEAPKSESSPRQHHQTFAIGVFAHKGLGKLINSIYDKYGQDVKARDGAVDDSGPEDRADFVREVVMDAISFMMPSSEDLGGNSVCVSRGEAATMRDTPDQRSRARRGPPGSIRTLRRRGH